MSETEKNVADQVRDQVEGIVTEGQDVRKKVARLVAEAVERCCIDREGLIGMVRSTLDGANAAIQRAVPQDPGSTLRQVVDGLGDGLSSAALACRLAFEEAGTHGRTFATEDMAKLRTELKSLSDLFVDTVSNTLGRFRTLAAGQLGVLRSHAEQTRTRILPSLESALAAAREHPVQLAKESAGAGLNVSCQALGALFGAVGRRLTEAGQRLTGEGPGT
jgi:hypothetical protein